MDILEIIKTQASSFMNEQPSGMQAVLSHLERAADLLEDGKEENDVQSFNDVIYRTNQAYEGILKEGYKAISGEDAGRMRLYDIEKYFKTEQVLSGRVLQLFENYRRQWRNPSTHDYQLFFSVNEAFLAIVSVVAFTHALLDRMIEYTTFASHREPRSRSLSGGINSMDALLKSAVQLSRSFIRPESLQKESKPVILGKLIAHWANNEMDVIIKREEAISEDGMERYYDFCLKTSEEEKGILVEVILNPKPITLEHFQNLMQKDIKDGGYFSGLIVLIGDNPDVLVFE